jgi:mRNA-degrading endonuclease toxin of MazEF toxin-antitoxin module
VVPLTSTPRRFPSHVTIEPDGRNGLVVSSCAQVELVRSVAVQRCGVVRGNVGGVVVHQLLDILAMIVGMP